MKHLGKFTEPSMQPDDVQSFLDGTRRPAGSSSLSRFTVDTGRGRSDVDLPQE